MTKFNMGDEVFVQESGNTNRRGQPPRLYQGVVTKVGRVNVTVKWSDGWDGESTFRMDDGRENTAHTRNYLHDARHVYTPEQWAEHETREQASSRITAHRNRGILDYGGTNKVSTSDLVRLADLLDELAANVAKGA